MAEIELTPIPLVDIEGAEDIKNEYVSYEMPDYPGFIQELQGTGVQLTEDPGGVPLAELNKNIAHIDAQKTRISTILTRAIENESDLDVIARKAAIIYKREFDTYLLKDPVRSLPNKELREAGCNVLLKELKEVVDSIQGSHAQAKSFVRIVQGVLDKLDSTNKNISRQITVLQLQMDIGEMQRKSQPNPHALD